MKARIGGTVTRAAAVGLLAVVGCGEGGTEPADPSVIATIAVSPATATLVSIGDTVRFEAVARNSVGGELSASFTWSSDATHVLEVDASGLATAVANGSATIRASADDIDGDATGTVAQEIATLEPSGGDLQAGPAGFPLDSLIELTARDANGHPAVGAQVSFAVTGGGGVDPEVATSDEEGLVATSWTLGTGAGVQELEAGVPGGSGLTVVLSANALANLPATAALFDGDGQHELAERSLPRPIRVAVMDEFGNAAADVPVAFTVTGAGTVEPGEAFTDLDGVATAVWTLGPGLGEQTAQARVLVQDSLVSDSLDLSGSPVAFTAAAVEFGVSGVNPATATAGMTMTITGSGFAPEPAGNQVRVGGLLATVIEGTQTSLKIEVPSFGCAPAIDRGVVVSRGDLSGGVPAVVQPVDPLELAVGAYAILDDPAAYCLQFPGSESGSDEYLVGLTGTRPLNGYSAFVITGEDGGEAAMAGAAFSAARVIAPMAAATTLERAAGASPEGALREWERAFLATRPGLARTRGAGDLATEGLQSSLQVSADPVPGESMSFRLPDITGDPCNAYTTVDGTVAAVGAGVVVVADADVPPLVLQGISTLLTSFQGLFSGTILERAITYFGATSDLDGNGRLIVVFTRAVGPLGVPAFSTAVDLADRSVCPSSDEGEIVYVALPAALTLAEVTAAIQGAGPNVAHELTHVIQSSRRMGEGLPSLPGWLAEGAAELAVEVVGRAIRGDEGGMDYGASVLAADVDATRWYRPRFDRLSHLFGWDGTTGRFDGAPERCSLYGFAGLNVPCADDYASGAAWAFIRYLSDRIGDDYVGGETAMHRALVMLRDAEDVADVLETLTGTTIQTLMVEWAMTLYTDGRLAGEAAGDLQLGSWDLADIYDTGSAERRLTPDAFDFSAFQRDGSIIGGGTAYLSISADAGHGPLTVRARDSADKPLGRELGTRLWVVRLR